MVSENAIKRRTTDNKTVDISKTELTTDSSVVKTKRSNKVKIQSGKPGDAQHFQPAQRKKYSAEANTSSQKQKEAVKKSINQSPATPKQVWRVTENIKPSKDSSKSSSKKSLSERATQDQPVQSKNSADAVKTLVVKKSGNQTQFAKESGNQPPQAPKQLSRAKVKTGPSKDSSSASSDRSLSKRVKQKQPAQKKHSAEAVRKSGNQIKIVKKSQNRTQISKKSGNQPPQAPQKVSGLKVKRESSKDSFKASSKMSFPERVKQGQPVQNNNSAEAVKKSGNKSPQALVSGVKEKTEPLKDSSKSFLKMTSSKQVKQAQPVQNKYSAEAVTKSTNETQAVKKSRNQTQDAKKSGNQAPKHVSRVKEKTKPSKDSSKSSSKGRSKLRREQNTDNHHIKWDDGFVESVEQNCCLCEIDLAQSPLPIEEEFESYKLPDIAVLPCGHLFHLVCLENAIHKELLKDPSCFMCASVC